MRIRSTKPEFWKSRRIASVSWDARLVLKGLESYVDDNGVGIDDIELIVTDVFPRDMFAKGSETVARVSEAITELHQAGLVHRYTTKSDHLLYISWWESIQRIDKPGKGRNPRPDGTWNYRDSEIREGVVSPPETLAPGTGEQGNRGTEEQGTSSSDADASDAEAPKPELEFSDATQWLCSHLADKIKSNGNKVGSVGVRWHQAMERLQRIDGYTPDQIMQVIDWCQQDEFWQGNILSAVKLREKFDQLKTKMFNERNKPASSGNRSTDRMLAGLQAMSGFNPAPPNPWEGKELEQ